MKKILMTVVLLSAVRTMAWPADQGVLAFQCASNSNSRTIVQMNISEDMAVLHQPLADPEQSLQLKKTQENENMTVYSGFIDNSNNQINQRMLTLDQAAFHPVSNAVYDMHVMYLVGNNQNAQSVDDSYTCVQAAFLFAN